MYGITELTVENVKGVVSISFNPQSTNIIGGDNGQGKSSLIDAITLTLKNKSMGRFTEKLIHDDAEYALTEITFFDGNKVQSKWHKDGRRELRFVKPDGENIPSPQKAIDEVVSGFAFDPIRFYNLSKEEQYEEVLRLTDLNLEEVDKTLIELKEKRRDMNRELDRITKVISEFSGTEPIFEVNAKEVAEELQKAQEFNAQFDNIDRQIQSLENSKRINETSLNNNIFQIRQMENQIEQIKFQIKTLENTNVSISNDNSLIDQKINNLKFESQNANRIDIEPLKEKLSKISEHNSLAEKYKRYKSLLGEQEIAVNNVNEVESLLKKERQKKIDAINSLNLMEGLSVDEDSKLLSINGIPIKQLSSSEQMMFALKLATKGDPKYKILMLQNASLLDNKTMNEVINYCQQEGWQLFIEKVGKGEYIIKEGLLLNPVEREKYLREYNLWHGDSLMRIFLKLCMI